jgi:hypothetical protein
MGYQAGYGAKNANYSNFLGSQAGQVIGGQIGAWNSNLFGQRVGQYATGVTYSNFMGFEAGSLASNSNDSNFIEIGRAHV